MAQLAKRTTDADVTDAAPAVDWDPLIAQHQRRVVVSLLAMGVGIEEAKEIAQEAWLRLVEQSRRGKLGELRLPGLAVQQARFLALERRRGRRHRELSVAVLPDVRDERQRIEESVEGRRRLERAERAVAACGPRAREVFALVYGPAAMSHHQAAAQLGMSVQRVRQTLCEIRKRLRMALENDHE